MANISNGTYCIKQADTGSVLDVPHEGGDVTPVHACIHHGRENQQWIVENVEGGCHIRSVSSGRFLGIPSDAPPAPICPLAVSREAFVWRIEPVPGHEDRVHIVDKNDAHGPFALKEIGMMDHDGAARDDVMIFVLANLPGSPGPEGGKDWVFERI